MVASSVLWKELGVAPVAAIVASQRARALKKFPTVKTVVSSLMTNRTRATHTWATLTRTWLKKFGLIEKGYDSRIAEQADLTWRKRVRDCVVERMVARDRTLGNQQYVGSGYEDTRGYQSLALKYPALTIGFLWLARMRCSAVLTTVRAVKMGLIPREYLDRCPLCHLSVREDIAHILVRCERWSEERQAFLGKLLSKLLRASRASSMGLSHRSEDVAILLLGGEARGVALGGWLKPTTKMERRGKEAICVSVARFLQHVMDSRTRKWHAWCRGIQVANEFRLHATSTSQSPNG